MAGLHPAGRRLLEDAMEMAQELRAKRQFNQALDRLGEIINAFPSFEPAYRLMLQIMREGNYCSENILWVMKNLERLGKLGPKNRLEMGIEELKAKNHSKALILLEEALRTPRQTLEGWGYKYSNIEKLAERCRSGPGKAAGPIEIVRRAPGIRIPDAEKRAPKKASIEPARQEASRVAPAQPAVPTPVPAAPVPATEPPPPLNVSLSIESAESLLAAFTREGLSTVPRYFLAQQAKEFTQAEQYESLLCLGALRGVTRYSYQVETVRKVLKSFRGRVLLADEVGLGKTIEAGMILQEYRLRGMVKKALVLVPPALVSQWQEELESKFGLSSVTTESAEVRQDPEAFWRNNNLIVASLALARNQHHQPILSQVHFDMVIVDEAHHVKKNRTAGWKLVNELKSRFLLLLTATPVENDLLDLYNLVTLLKPGQLSTRLAFKREYMERGDPTTPKNRERLRELIGEVMIRNTRALADIKLPARHATTVLVECSPAEQALYQGLTELVREGYQGSLSRLALGLLLQEAGSSPRAVQGTLLKMSENGEIPLEVRKRMGELAGICAQVQGTAKTSRLLDLVRASKEKILVFSRFAATLEELGDSLTRAKISFSSFTGRQSAQEKVAAVEAFRTGNVSVMLCSEIGGEGHNLQFCSTLVNFDLPWNPMKIEQRIGRIHRIGQEQPVHIYNLCARGTAEDHILEVLDRRINLFELVIGEVDLILGQMKNEAEFEERILAIYGESRSDEEVKGGFEELGAELERAKKRYDKVKQLDSAIFSNDYEV